MEQKYRIDQRNKVKRIPKRGHYDQKTVFEILDAGFIAHVAFVLDGQPFIIPTAYGRQGNSIYLHGATKSRMLKALQKGIPVSLAVTHLDGIVLARSLFNSSMNYRSVVVYGKAMLIEDEEEKMKGLEAISDQILKGRWQEARLPSAKEMKATTVLKLNIEQASAKIRTGPPEDDKPDYDLPIWAGTLPCQMSYDQPVTDPGATAEYPLPDSVSEFISQQ